MIGTYKITNIINQMCYYGSSINVKRRFNNHKVFLRKGIHHCKKLQNDWNKFSENFFIFELVEECEKYDLLDKETILLQSDNIYNHYKKAHANYSEKHPRYGKNHTDESREKIKKARKKQVITHSIETKQKISDSNKGRVVPIEHIIKMVDARGGKSWNKGIKMDYESPLKIKIDHEPIIELYNDGMSIEKIRKQYGVSWDVIKRILIENSVEIRTISQQKIITNANK